VSLSVVEQVAGVVGTVELLAAKYIQVVCQLWTVV